VDESLDGAPTLWLEGEWCISSVERLRAPVDGLVQAGVPALVLDLRRTTFMDVVALHVLLDARDALAAHGRPLILVATPPRVRRLLELTGTAESLQLVPDGAAARRAIASHARPTAP